MQAITNNEEALYYAIAEENSRLVMSQNKKCKMHFAV